MTLHIAQLANFYTSTSGGLRTAIDSLGRGYRNAGHQTTLVVPGEIDDVVVDDGGTVVTVAAPILPGSGGYRMITRRSAVREVLNEFSPDRIELSDKATLVDSARWARERGVPSLLISHERLDAILSHRLPRFRPSNGALRRYNRWLARQVDVIVGASSFALREFTSVGATNVELVPLGVDLDTFRPEPVARRSGVLQLVYAGRMSEEKGPHLPIDAAGILAERGINFQLTMIGDGPRLVELQAAASGLPVRFRGHISSRSALAAALARADIALLPSPAETFGLAALEAMACGTPVIVARGRGSSELVVPDGGLGVRPSGVAIADGIEQLAAVPREHTRAVARRRAEAFSWQRTIDSMLRVHLGVSPVAA